MLCASHCNFFEYPQSITGSFIFSLFNFQGPTHFSESFLSVFTEPLSTVRMLLYHTLSCLSTLFSNFFKKFFKAHQVFSVLSPLSSSDECYYITPFYKLQPLFSNFLKNFLRVLHILYYYNILYLQNCFILLSVCYNTGMMKTPVFRYRYDFLINLYMTLFVPTQFISQPQYSDNAQSNSGRFIFITQNSVKVV